MKLRKERTNERKMPLVSSHCFANHKGGCGKTTLGFQAVCTYAQMHPEQKVAIFDATTLGDISKLFLGGDIEGRGKGNLFTCNETGRTFTAVINSAIGAADKKTPGGVTSPGVISGMLNRLRIGGDNNSALVDFSELLNVREVNASVPENVFLAAGGPSKENQVSMSPDEAATVAQVLKDSLNATTDTWKVFVDTDGDLSFAPYTQVALKMCDCVVLPLKPNFNDFDRIETFFEELHPIGAAKIHLLVWNEVDANSFKPCPPLSKQFTPPKASQDIIRALNQLVAEVARSFPSLFVHPVVETPSGLDDFAENSSMLMQQFGSIGIASAQHGIPFCSMVKGPLKGARIEYLIDDQKLDRLKENIELLVENF